MVFAYTKRGPYLKLIIEEDLKVGFYLLVYPIDSQKSIADYLQDDLETVLLQAEDMYGVKKDECKDVAVLE